MTPTASSANDELEEGGFYWVKLADEWQVAQWYGGAWWFTGSEVPRGASDVDRYEGPLRRE